MASTIYSRSSAEFDRGVQFFDAIYGFAITLLITTVRLPPSDAWTSLGALMRSPLPSQLYGFVLSFVVIAVFWRQNYRMVGSLTAMDSAVVVANIACAFFIVLITFTTQALHEPSTSNLPLPVSLYALNIALAAIAQIVMMAIAKGRGLTSSEATDPEGALWLQALRRSLVPGVFLVSIPIAFLVNVQVAQYSWALLLLLVPLVRSALKRSGLRALT